MSNEWVSSLVNRVVDQQNAETAVIKAQQEYQEPVSQQHLAALIHLREQAKPIFIEALMSVFTGADTNSPPVSERALRARIRSQRVVVAEKMTHLHLGTSQLQIEEQLALENNLREVVLARTYDAALSDAMVQEFAQRASNTLAVA